ncbi:hypothetical protein ACWEWX_50335, partial [Streptomyces asiaticus]
FAGALQVRASRITEGMKLAAAEALAAVVADEPSGPEVDGDALKDPLAYGRTTEHPLPAPILGHGDYQADPAFDRERAGLLARLPEQTPPPAEEAAGQMSSGRSSG